MTDPEALLRELARTLSRGARPPGGRGVFSRRSRGGREEGSPQLFEVPGAPSSRSGSPTPGADGTSESSSGSAPAVEAGPNDRAGREEPLAEGAIRARRSARAATRTAQPTAQPTARGRRAGDRELDPALELPFAETEARSRIRPEGEPGPEPSRPPLRPGFDGATSRQPRREGPAGRRGGAVFETFAVDEENRLAYRAVIESAYRPGVLAKLVFLYGARGTGKTHLLRSCEQVLATRGLRVVVRDAERLTQEFTSAVAEARADALFEALSGGEALLLDEVHRLGQRRATRDFVGRLLLRYVESGRLVLLASRWHPRQIHALPERWISLFLSGFSVQVRPPAEATKERWLRQRHRLLTGEDPPRELHRLSRAIRGGLGDLASAHDRFLFGAEIEELAGLYGEGMPAVIAATAERLGLEPGMLEQRASSRALSRARDVASHVALRLGYRAEIVGRHLGGRSPQTVRAAARRVAGALDTDAELRRAVETILVRLSG